VSLRAVAATTLVAAIAMAMWPGHLLTPGRPGPGPLPLRERSATSTRVASFDLVLPSVAGGMERLRAGGGPLLVHYWAPWEHHSAQQARLLDSLAHDERARDLRVAMVCFDPFPSVARFVGRHRLRLPVLLDGDRHLSSALPCPSVPFTYLIDRGGHVVVAQPGEVDWWAPATLAAVESALTSGGPPPPAL
jgi:hypothetical protein